MAVIDTIFTLRARGWSHREIADALGIHRETVARYLHQAGVGGSRPRPKCGSETRFVLENGAVCRWRRHGPDARTDRKHVPAPPGMPPQQNPGGGLPPPPPSKNGCA